MDIREVTEAEKRRFFEKAEEFFFSIRATLNTLEQDIKFDDDLMKQASAVWITGNMAIWYSDFMEELRKIHLQKDEIQQQIQSIAEEEKRDD